LRPCVEAEDCFKTNARQGDRHIFGIIARIGQVEGVIVGAVSDHQGDSVVGSGKRRGPDDEGEGQGQKTL
jgi:hypothetical protein